MRKASMNDVHRALQVIVDNRQEKSLCWAVNYARCGISETGDTLRRQCLYVLSNISKWRGEQAEQVRSTLKSFCGLRH